MAKVKEFLESDQKVFLLMGNSGAGKSTFIRELEFELWQSYKKESGRIPLCINLPTIDKPEQDMIAKQLRRNEFTEPQIREMKENRKLIVICDGYDESQQSHNLYTSNGLNQPGQWNAQMVISCRTEYLGVDYRDRFQPGDRNQQSDSSLLHEAVITPFSFDQVQAYVKKYVSIHQPPWRLGDYVQALKLIPSLRELVKNPFLMTLTLDVLPRMVDPGQNLSDTRVTRLGLYDHFVQQWLERGKKRIGEKDLGRQTRATFERLSDEGFTQNGINFMKRLAVAIYKEQGGMPIVEYTQYKDEGSWKDAFFRHEDKKLLREACPLTRNGNRYRFIHRSLLEYGLARSIFDPHDRRNVSFSEPVLRRRGSTSSTLSFEYQDDPEHESSALEKEPDINSPLVWRSFVNDHSLLEFLEEYVKQEPLFKNQLLDYIEYSKKDKKWRTAAANAITILVRAGVRFVEANLNGIRIPGADLSYGIFDSTLLQDADLRKVNFRGTWLRQTDMSRAQMTGAQFGELPSLTEDRMVYSCAYSPDGGFLAVGLENGVKVYATATWERTWTSTSRTECVWYVDYSPKGDQIVSCSSDDVVRLWDAVTGSLLHELSEHTGRVYRAAYSPQGEELVSASLDKTIRRWNVSTGECLETLSGASKFHCVTYSPNGSKIASGTCDGTVQVWNLETKDISRLTGHSNVVCGVRYSPRGDQLASASDDMTIRLWNVDTGVCTRTLSGHIGIVLSVAYSPSGDQLASCGKDGTVRIWDANTGRCRETLTGHNQFVLSVVYDPLDPKGNRIATGSVDKTVRLWDISTGASHFVSSSHSVKVNNVKYSPQGNLIASCSSDCTIRLWDAKTGTCRGILSGHKNSIFGMAFSPKGDRIVSASSGNTVRLWDVDTGICCHTFTGHSESVQGVAYSPRGNMVASVSYDKTVKLWDVDTGEHLRTMVGHTDPVMSVVFSPDGLQIATGSKDCTARIWKAETGECCHTLVDHTGWVRNITYSPQGDQLASASYDKTIRLWDIKAGECRLTLIGHSDRLIGIAYSPQGDLLATSSWDKTVRLWDVASGQCRAVIRNLPAYMRSVAWSPLSNDSCLVTGSIDGSVVKWKVLKEEEECDVSPLWIATNGKLAVTGATIQDVRGLSVISMQLLKQRGAIGEPEHLLRKGSKKLITMSSVVSILKQSSDGTIHPVEQLVELEQSTELLPDE
jgi:WD40 repeat protein